MLPAIAKILAKVILERIKEYLERFVSREQIRFRFRQRGKVSEGLKLKAIGSYYGPAKFSLTLHGW